MENIEIKTGFKVCRKEGIGTYKSALSYGKTTEYNLGVWTNRPPRCGPLAIFGRLRHARHFIDNNSGFGMKHMILLCEYEESNEKKLYSNKREITPPNTIYADKVKLMFEI